MWICSKCQRKFTIKNQSHSCVVVKIEDLFVNKNPDVFNTFIALKKRCRTFCDIEIDTTKSCLYFSCPQRFIALKPSKSHAIIEFVLNRKVDVFPVIKAIEIGKNRYAHRLALDSPSDISVEVMGWIKEAYEICNEKL